MLECSQWQGRRHVGMQREVLELRARLRASLLLAARLLRALRREELGHPQSKGQVEVEPAAWGPGHPQFKGQVAVEAASLHPQGGSQAGLWREADLEWGLDMPTGTPAPEMDGHERARAGIPRGPGGEPQAAHPWAAASVYPETAESYAQQPAWHARARSPQGAPPHGAAGAAPGPPPGTPQGVPRGLHEAAESWAESPWWPDECSEAVDESVEAIMALDSLQEAEAWEAGPGPGYTVGTGPGKRGAGDVPGCSGGALVSEFPWARDSVEMESEMGESQWGVESWKEMVKEECGMRCYACREDVSSALLLPCRHLAACKGCAPRLTECPACSKAVQGVMYVAAM